MLVMLKYVIWVGLLIIFMSRGKPFVGLISIWHLKWSFSRNITFLSIIGLLECFSINFFMALLHFLLKVLRK